MKKTIKFIAMAIMVAAVSAACSEKNPSPNPDGGGSGGKKNYPPITLEEPLLSGPVKVGFADQIEITGTGFDPEVDYIYVYYEDGGETKRERIQGNELTLRRTRVSFGVPITATYIDKTIKVYLERSDDYEIMPITGDITFTMPTVAEGYIPDPGFRASLMSTHDQQGNKEIANLFDKTYGLLDVAGAANIKTINLYGSTATSLEGIELFTGANRLIAHETSNLEVADFSKWKSSGPIFITMERSAALKEIIGGMSIGRLDCYDCDNLQKVDVHLSDWMYNFQLFIDKDPEKMSNVNYLDIRRQRTGTRKGGPLEGAEGYTYCHNEGEYTTLLSGVYMRVKGDCHILVDYDYLTEKWGGTGETGSGYNCIYRAWKLGATVDVYDSKDITKKLGTVPAYEDDNDALTLPGEENGWKPE